MKSAFRIAVVFFGVLASFSFANEFIPGHYAYQIEVKDPEGIRTTRKICISLIKKDERLVYKAADASEDTNCVNASLYGSANDVQSTKPFYDRSKMDEVGILKDKQGREVKWVYLTEPVAHRTYLTDDKGKNGKWIWVCSVPIVRDEDKFIPEVYQTEFAKIDARYLRVEICAVEKTESTIVKHPTTGEEFRRDLPHCPAAKVCLEEDKRIKSLRFITNNDAAHDAQTTSSTVNQETHGSQGRR